ncbi:MAG: Na+ dependent nucleoside transporter domain protein [Gemmataceae bacterium]|nr:Na+ dependent nucleoside transporter domain protein [Gemmataceae bacterium]
MTHERADLDDPRDDDPQRNEPRNDDSPHSDPRHGDPRRDNPRRDDPRHDHPTRDYVRWGLRLAAVASFGIAVWVRHFGRNHGLPSFSRDGALVFTLVLAAVWLLSFLEWRWLQSPAVRRSIWSLLGVAGLVLLTYLLVQADWIGPNGQALFGIACFLGLAVSVSSQSQAINWRTVGWGFALQVFLALIILKFSLRWEGETIRPVYELFRAAGDLVTRFLSYSDRGAEFVFGALADRGGAMTRSFGPGDSYVFAFRALPTVIFISAFFTVLYHIGLLPFVVKWMARAMMWFMRTSGAESLSAAANVFMGQTEAPLIVKPFIPRMTSSELLAIMAGGMATIAGSVMAVYIGMGADPVAILATSVMAAPCGLYIAKIVLPETETPETSGSAPVSLESPHRNIIDAFSAGASDGVQLAINIAAMLIAFIALIAMIDSVLGLLHDDLSLRLIFARLFAPAAMLIGVEPADVEKVGGLLGTKLAANEFVAYADLARDYVTREAGTIQVRGISVRSYQLATFALTGFANFASIGIQLGGIGAMAPSRRRDLARLGGRALFVGFVATMLNAAIAGVLL